MMAFKQGTLCMGKQKRHGKVLEGFEFTSTTKLLNDFHEKLWMLCAGCDMF